MRTSLTNYEVDPSGDICAYGSAFRYQYDAVDNTLAIYRNISGCKTLRTKLPAKITTDPLLFIEHLEKATQIKALLLSANKTVKLCETIVPEKLSAIAKSVSKLALNSYDLKTDNLEKYSRLIKRSYGLAHFEIVRISYDKISDSYFKAKIISCKNNQVIVRDENLHRLLRKLSEKIISDLIPLEYSSRSNACTDQLLRLSTRLSVMGKIVDSHFFPEKYLESPSIRHKNSRTDAI